MTALQGLFELLRVAEQDQAPSPRGSCQYVAQGHLAGLIDEEHIDALLEVRPTPAPGSGPQDVDLTAT